MKSTDKPFSVEVPGQGKISCLRTTPAVSDAAWTFVYAPGAGSNLRDPFGAFAAAQLASRGLAMVRLQFPYMEAGRRGPDRPPVLEATWRAVIDAVRPDAGRFVVGGRSMGGRIASQVVAQGVTVDAVALFAYPLHPPGKPDQLRIEHFSSLRMPVLFCSGTRDAFASPDDLRAAAKKIRGAKVHLLQGADHGFAVPKSSGRTRDEVWSEAVDTMTDWLAKLK
jgi:uncharacterized protein